MAYPIDLIQDENREILRRQTLGMSANLNALSRQEQATGAALANMFATGEKMRQQDEADLYRQQVMEQRQRGQQASLEARALEAQRGREFRSREAGKARAFQRAQRRRGVGSSRKIARIDRMMKTVATLMTSQDRSPGDAARKLKIATTTAKRIAKLDPASGKLAYELVGAPATTPLGLPHVVSARGVSGQAASERATLAREVRIRGDFLKRAGDVLKDVMSPEEERIRAREAISTNTAALVDILEGARGAQALPQALAAQAAPPTQQGGGVTVVGGMYPVSERVRQKEPQGVEFPGPVGTVWTHDGVNMKRIR